MSTRKAFTGDIKVLAGERAVAAVITTNAIDRDGEIVLQNGVDLSDFEANPIVLFNHDRSQPPVGKCVAIKRNGDSIEAKAVFADRPANHEGPWLPDVLLSLFQQGVLKAFSIGFMSKGRSPNDAERKVYGPGLQYVHEKTKLLEFSVVTLPANQEAIATAVSKGLITEADASVVTKCGPYEMDDAEEEAPSYPIGTRVKVRGTAGDMAGKVGEVTLIVPDVTAYEIRIDGKATPVRWFAEGEIELAPAEGMPPAPVSQPMPEADSLKNLTPRRNELRRLSLPLP